MLGRLLRRHAEATKTAPRENREVMYATVAELAARLDTILREAERQEPTPHAPQ